MPMELGQVGSCSQHWRISVLYIRFLLVVLAERGACHGGEFQLGRGHVPRYCLHRDCGLVREGSSCLQGSGGVLGRVEGEINNQDR